MGRPALDFTPSEKIQEKIDQIVTLREKYGKNWYDIADAIGHTRRYCQSLYKYHKDTAATHTEGADHER